MTVWDSMALNTPHTEREIRSIHETGAGDLPTKLDGFPLLEEAIKEHYGPRCDEYMAGCPCCDTWAELDRLRAIRAAESRELAHDGEPAPGSTTEPQGATSPSAGLSGGLLPCPFCGGEAIYTSRKGPRHMWDMDEAHWVYCSSDDCLADFGMCETADEAIAGWNRRPGTSAALAIVTAEKASWPHAGAMHDGARMACNNIIRQLEARGE